MTLTTRPVPIGELLEKLRAEGFSVAPAQYGRVFTVVEAVFPDGLSAKTNTADRQELRELIGPIVCRTFAEQERFGPLFDSVMAGQLIEDEELETDDPEPPKPVTLLSPGGQLPKKQPVYYGLGQIAIVGALAVLLSILFKPKPDPKPEPVLDCTIDFAIQPVQGNTVTFINRSPGLKNGQLYKWDFGDGTPPISTSLATVQHQFSTVPDSIDLANVTPKAVGCPDVPPPNPDLNKTNYNPTPLPFLRLPETSQFTLANWVPLLLMGLGGLLGGGWWLARRRRQRGQAAQRPTEGPLFLSFPQQDDGIQPSPSLLSWAQQLQQREESERHVLAIAPTIRQTIRNGGMPGVRYESIKRRPRYLILIDDRSAYDQQAKLYGYVMNVLVARNVDMDVFFFHYDPRYAWNENYPKGLPISDLLKLYNSHYLVLVSEGSRLFDYDTGEMANWATDVLSGWTSRALLTPVYPANWHYLEAALSRFFILLPATPDGQFLLRDSLVQPDKAPLFTELLQQFKVLPGTPNRGIFGLNATQLTVADVRSFLSQPFGGTDQTESMQGWLFTWACATAVFPTPDWAMTLAIGRALEEKFEIEGLVTSTNILKLTALPWLRQDHIPEPLRSNLLAELSPDVETLARKTAVTMLNSLEVAHGSVAHEEQQLRLWEQEYHLKDKHLGQLSTYRQYPELIKDAGIQQRLTRQDRVENQYQPSGLLVLLLLPLLLYLTPPQTQVASVLLPFFRTDSTAADSATFYNNRAVARFKMATPADTEPYGTGILDLVRSLESRLTFESVHNLNTARYNRAVLERSQQLEKKYPANEVSKMVQQQLSPFEEVPQLMKPFGLFDKRWVPDSAVTRQYLMMLSNKIDNIAIFEYVEQANLQSVNSAVNQSVGISKPIDWPEFERLINRAKGLFQSAGVREFEQDSLPAAKARLNRILLIFKPSTTQRDSLISLEAARIVLYFGGPRKSRIVPLEASQGIARGTTEAMVPAKPSPSGSTGGGWREPVRKPLPSNQATPRPRRSQRATAPQGEPTTRLRYRKMSRTLPITTDSVSTQKPPVSTTITSRTATNYDPNTVSTPPVSKTIEQPNLPATVGNDDNPASQQAPEIDEKSVEEVYTQTTKCSADSPFSISLPKGEKRTIRAGVVILLSDTPTLYEVIFYCDSEPQTIYSKQGFSHVKVEKYGMRGRLRVVLYRNRARAK